MTSAPQTTGTGPTHGTGPRLAAATLAALLLAGCHHGGGSSAPPLGPDVTVSGTVTFDLVPTANIGGVWQLDYANTRSAPARGITVQIMNGTNVVASTTTDDTGTYSITAASNQNVFVRAQAVMRRSGSPSWTVGVTDNTQGDGIYVYDTDTFLLGSGGATRDLHAGSGWGGSSYTSSRSAAPFAILDAVYDAMQFVLANQPNALAFPTLQLHWSPNNVPTVSATGVYAPSGQIGSSFYATGYGIYLLGAQDQDTDEYDRDVITQAWGQYLLDSFGRDDSVVGPSAPGDQLDMRVAFREGFGTAIAAIVTGDPIYRNTQGPRQAQSISFNVEGEPATNPNPAPGWYSERSIHELLYNLYDSTANIVPDGSTTQDNVALDFAPLFSVVTGALQSTPAESSIFPFINALQQARPQDQANIDALVQALGMNSIVDDFGTTETHFGTPPQPKLTSVYDTVTVNGGPTNVCSLNSFKSTASGAIDKLGSRRYVRFSAGASGTYSFKAVAVNPPAAADPDLVLHQFGTIASSANAPSDACTSSWQTTAGVCSEGFSASLSPGNYVLEVYEWTNVTDDPRYPPIGDTCFDVTVTSP